MRYAFVCEREVHQQPLPSSKVGMETLCYCVLIQQTELETSEILFCCFT
jgi:hypothetical protein